METFYSPRAVLRPDRRHIIVRYYLTQIDSSKLTTVDEPIYSDDESAQLLVLDVIIDPKHETWTTIPTGGAYSFLELAMMLRTEGQPLVDGQPKPAEWRQHVITTA